MKSRDGYMVTKATPRGSSAARVQPTWQSRDPHCWYEYDKELHVVTRHTVAPSKQAQTSALRLHYNPTLLPSRHVTGGFRSLIIGQFPRRSFLIGQFSKRNSLSGRQIFATLLVYQYSNRLSVIQLVIQLIWTCLLFSFILLILLYILLILL